MVDTSGHVDEEAPAARDAPAGASAEPRRSPRRTAGAAASPRAATASAPRRHALARPARPLLLLRAAHPRQALLTALALAGAAALAGRAGRGGRRSSFATVLVGQAILGWHNDLVDRRARRADERRGKPIADG